MISKKHTFLFCIYTVIFVSLIFYVTVPNEFREITIEKNFVKIVNIEKKQLFDSMADVQNYPDIFPENFLSVIINEQYSNVLVAKETIHENGITTTLTVRHTITPYENQILEILDGDAKGTKITIIFEDIDSNTKISIKAEIHLTGLLIPFAYIPDSNLNHAVDTVIESFVNNLKNN